MRTILSFSYLMVISIPLRPLLVHSFKALTIFRKVKRFYLLFGKLELLSKFLLVRNLKSFRNLLFLLLEFVCFPYFQRKLWYMIQHTFTCMIFISLGTRFPYKVLRRCFSKKLKHVHFFSKIFYFWYLAGFDTISRYDIHFGARLLTFPVLYYSSNFGSQLP